MYMVHDQLLYGTLTYQLFIRNRCVDCAVCAVNRLALNIPLHDRLALNIPLHDYCTLQ